MESRAKLFGHPVHQMLIVFPLGLLGTAAIFDVVHAFTGGDGWATSSRYLIGAGVITALLAAVFGLIDFTAIPKGTRAKRVGAMHGIGNVIVVALFATSYWLRSPDFLDPPTSAILLSVGGLMLATVTGWLGGELVDRLSVGVDTGAHLNAPSSLSGKPASGRADGDSRMAAD